MPEVTEQTWTNLTKHIEDRIFDTKIVELMKALHHLDEAKTGLQLAQRSLERQNVAFEKAETVFRDAEDEARKLMGSYNELSSTPTTGSA